MKAITRILGIKGRITIPYSIRMYCNIKKDDILIFEAIDKDTVLIKLKNICPYPKTACCKDEENFDINEFLDRLSPKQQYDALVHLTLAWADNEKSGSQNN